jgi:hypothetical protein
MRYQLTKRGGKGRKPGEVGGREEEEVVNPFKEQLIYHHLY